MFVEMRIDRAVGKGHTHEPPLCSELQPCPALTEKTLPL